jgi:hypothetical protein
MLIYIQRALRVLVKQEKVKKTMTWNLEYTKPTFGIELEYYFSSSNCQSVAHCRRTLHDAGFDWLDVKTDGTAAVDVEIVFPPMVDCPEFRRDLSTIMEICKDLGLKYRTDCGLHVHIGIKRLKPATPIASYMAHVKERARQNFLMPDASFFCDEPMQFELLKDVVRRYSDQQNVIDAFMPQSRAAQTRGMLRSISNLTRVNEASFEQTENVSQLDRVIGGKYNAVNVATWDRGTIEFRQHPATLSSGKVMNWVSLLIGLIEDSDANRIDYAPSATREVTETVASPVQPYRRNSNIGLLWSACRISGGASVRQLVNITGMTPQNIRARFSEMRSAHGDDVIVMHTQQSYNNHYGSSNGQHDLGGYEVLEQVERTTSQASSGVCLMPNDIIGSADIYAGVSHSIARYFQRGVVTQTRL